MFFRDNMIDAVRGKGTLAEKIFARLNDGDQCHGDGQEII
ncbi:MAG: hypothetical protein N5P05_003089 [Chroococcopsis gigantea SAG 12.99]|nr:hypothetical protein [Chroococcopsis gigantea SAG 12.99]